MKDPYILRQGDKSPMVKVLKSLLNEVIKPSPKLVENEVFDLKTHSTVLKFKRLYELYRLVSLGGSDYTRVYDGVVKFPEWRQIGNLLLPMRRKEVAGQDKVLLDLLNGKLEERKVPAYTSELAQCDKKLARVFGGSGAVFAGCGFEPEEMPLYGGKNRYRGADRLGDDPEHLSSTGHLYGSNDGTAITGVYVPPGYAYLGVMASAQGRAEDGHSFYYKQWGGLRDVTLHIAHIANFRIRPNEKNEAGSVRIGDVGGRGGNSSKGGAGGAMQILNGRNAPYIHCHLAVHHGRGHNQGRRMSFVDVCAAI